jgi:chorismate synthase
VSGKSHGKRIKVLVDAMPKAPMELPDAALAPGVQHCGRERAGGCILAWFVMPKWKSWLTCR